MAEQHHHQKTIFHIIPRIEFGGTERMLTQTMLSADISSEWRQVLYVMKNDHGENSAKLKNAGVDIRYLNFQKGGLSAIVSIIKSIFRLRRDCQVEHPAIVMGWLYYGNILASLIAPKSTKVFHNIRNSAFDISRYKASIRFALGLNAILSKNVAMTIYNSFAGREDHQNRGFSKAKNTVIHNGIDTDFFTPLRLIERHGGDNMAFQKMKSSSLRSVEMTLKNDMIKSKRWPKNSLTLPLWLLGKMSAH